MKAGGLFLFQAAIASVMAVAWHHTGYSGFLGVFIFACFGAAFIAIDSAGGN